MNITASAVYQKYGSTPVLHDVSFTAAGEVVVLLGPNGSGKSTLIKTLAGILTPAGGTVSINGADRRNHRRGRAGETHRLRCRSTFSTRPSPRFLRQS